MIREIKGNILDDRYKYIAIGVTADFSMGAGVALALNEKFDISNNIKQYANKEKITRPSVVTFKDEETGTLIFNLVDKKNRYEKLSYENLYKCIDILKEELKKEHIPYIVMPRIGCGMDKLEWDIVKNHIETVFKDTKIDVLILHI